ncbi:MAG: hypothetical protein OXG43_02870 [Chloroflexi bacterium]|nr:hypothetical protein [Chloroflexota bacterium]
MSGRWRILSFGALAVALAAVAAVLALTFVAGRGSEATNAASQTATPSPPGAVSTEAVDGTPPGAYGTMPVTAEILEAPVESRSSVGFPIVDAAPLQLARTCPFVGHHAASHQLLRFLTSVDNAIFALDPAIGHLALLADGARRGQVEPVRLMAASGAVTDALRLSPALAPRPYGGPALFAHQFRLLRGLALLAGETQFRLIDAFTAGYTNDRFRDTPGEAVYAVLGLVNGLEISVEFRDNLIRRLIPFDERPRGC